MVTNKIEKKTRKDRIKNKNFVIISKANKCKNTHFKVIY